MILHLPTYPSSIALIHILALNLYVGILVEKWKSHRSNWVIIRILKSFYYSLYVYNIWHFKVPDS